MNLKLSDEFISYLKELNLSSEEKSEFLKNILVVELFKDNKEIFEGANPMARVELEMLDLLTRKNLMSYSTTEGYKLTHKTFAFQKKEEKQKDKFNWVENFRNLFKEVNPDRWGTLSTCKERMKKFFSENPEVRVDEVINATIMYLKNTDRRYIMKSHKFIYDGAGTSRNSTLEEWIEKFREVSKNTKTSEDITDKIQ